jgi:hypothetical protein
MIALFSVFTAVLLTATHAGCTTTDPVVEVSPRHICAELSDELWAAVERGEITENQSADLTLRCWLNETSRVSFY